MTVPSTTLLSLQSVLKAALRGSGTLIKGISVDENPQNLSTPFRHLVLRKAGASAVPINIEVTEWGNSLELSNRTWKGAIDPTIDLDTAIGRVMNFMAPRITQQVERAAKARAAGISRPLEGNDLLSTAHLSVDMASVQTLITYTGSAQAARQWLDEQMEYHRSHFVDRDYSENLIIRVINTNLHIPFALSPLMPARGTGDASTALWEDDTIYLSASLPETLNTALEGRYLRELVSGTPVGDRIIIVAVDGGMPGDPSTTVLIESLRCKVDDLLPPTS